MNDEHVSNAALLQRVLHRRGKQRELMAEQIRDLAVIYRRRAHVEAGYENLWQFLTRFLGMPNGSASRYMHAAKLASQAHGIVERLADGRLNLGTLMALRPALAPIFERRDAAALHAILEEAAGRDEAACAVIAVTHAPKPVTADSYRRLPAPPALSLALAPTGQAAATSAPAPTPARSGPPAPRIEPVTAELRKLSVTVGQEFDADLMAVREALSHQVPDGNLVEILHECLRAKLREVQRKREGAGRKQAGPSEAEGRYIPVAVKAAVWRRDQSQCTYVSPDGHHCRARWKLQLDHVVPFAQGGEATVENLRLRCQTHNLWKARQELGDQALDRHVPVPDGTEARSALEVPANGPAHEAGEQQTHQNASDRPEPAR